jgi:hypothetical protein
MHASHASRAAYRFTAFALSDCYAIITACSARVKTTTNHQIHTLDVLNPKLLDQRRRKNARRKRPSKYPTKLGIQPANAQIFKLEVWLHNRIRRGPSITPTPPQECVPTAFETDTRVGRFGELDCGLCHQYPALCRRQGLWTLIVLFEGVNVDYFHVRDGRHQIHATKVKHERLGAVVSWSEGRGILVHGKRFDL